MKAQKRINKKGEVSFFIRASVGFKDNKQVIKSMTWKPDKDMTPKQIEKELTRQTVLFEEKAKQEYKKQLELEAEKEDEIEYAKKHLTFQELAEEWLNLQIINSGAYKRSTVTKLLDCKERTYQAIGDVLVTKLNYLTVQSFITSLSKKGVNMRTGKGLSVKSQKAYLNFVSDVMLFAKRRGIVEHNPCRDIVFTKSEADYNEKEMYSLEETKAILSAMKKAPIDYQLFFSLLAFCGLRKAEALGLEFKDFTFGIDESIMNIVRTSNYHQGYGVYTDTPKTAAGKRSMVIQPVIVELIKRLKAEKTERAKKCGDQWVDSDRLFVNWCGKPLHPNIPYKWLKRFCEQEGLVFRGLHSFRHFFISYSIAGGVEPMQVATTAGQKTLKSTERYRHSTEKNNRNATNCIGKLLDIA